MCERRRHGTATWIWMHGKAHRQRCDILLISGSLVKCIQKIGTTARDAARRGRVVKGEGGNGILGTTMCGRTGRVQKGVLGVLVGDRGGRREVRHMYRLCCYCVFFLGLWNDNNTNETKNTRQNSEASSTGG